LPFLLALIAPLALAGCFESTGNPITPGRYYLAEDLAKGGPDSATVWFEYLIVKTDYNDLHRYREEHFSPPGCRTFLTSGTWDVIGKGTKSRIEYSESALEDTYSYSGACIPDSAHGRWVEVAQTYRVRNITTTSYEACFREDGDGDVISECEAGSPDWKLYTLLTE
jgi:hypothetical protein